MSRFHSKSLKNPVSAENRFDRAGSAVRNAPPGEGRRTVRNRHLSDQTPPQGRNTGKTQAAPKKKTAKKKTARKRTKS